MIKTFAASSYKLLALPMLAKLQPEFGHCAFGMRGIHGLTKPCALWCFSAVASCCYGPDFSAQSSHPKVASCTLTAFNTHGRLAEPTAKKHGSPVSEAQIFTCQRLPELPDRAGILPHQMATSHGLPTKSRSLQANSSFIPWKVSRSSVVQGQPHAAKPVMTCKCFQTTASNLESMCDFAFQSTLTYILPMENAQLGWSKDLKSWDVHHITWYSPKFVHTTQV